MPVRLSPLGNASPAQFKPGSDQRLASRGLSMQGGLPSQNGSHPNAIPDNMNVANATLQSQGDRRPMITVSI